MQIAIISDIHDNLPNLQKVLDYCADQKIEKIICCGDITNQESLDFLNDNFSGEIFYAFGNADEGHLEKESLGKKYKKTSIFPDFGEASMEDKKIAFVHFPDKAKELAENGQYDFVFYGHTHKPWTEKIGKCEMLNPGNVAGTFYPPTFAVWNLDDGKFSLIRVHDLK
jgi:putative phosphoesterase